MKTSFQIIIFLCFIISTLQKHCLDVQLATKETCTSSEISSGYYKCCYFKGTIDKVSTGEKVLNLFAGTNRQENDVLNYCVQVTEGDYNDINKYIKEHKSMTFEEGTIEFDEVYVDCFCNYQKVTFWILFIFSLIII